MIECDFFRLLESMKWYKNLITQTNLIKLILMLDINLEILGSIPLASIYELIGDWIWIPFSKRKFHI